MPALMSAGRFFDKGGDVWSGEGVLPARSRRPALPFGPRTDGTGA